MCDDHPIETPLPGLELSGWTEPVGGFGINPLPGTYDSFESYRFLTLYNWRVAHIRRVTWRGGHACYTVYAMDMRGAALVAFDTYHEAERYLEMKVREKARGADESEYEIYITNARQLGLSVRTSDEWMAS